MTAAQTRERSAASSKGSSAARQGSQRSGQTHANSKKSGQSTKRTGASERNSTRRSSRGASSGRESTELATSTRSSRRSGGDASDRRQHDRSSSRYAAPPSATDKLKALPSSASGAVAGAIQTAGSKASDFMGTHIFSKRRRAVLLVVLVVVLVVGCILYGPGRTYYQSLRSEQRTEAIAKAYSDRNEAIKKQNEELKTDEGVESAAREEYGWVKEGESAVNITNAGGSSVSTSKLPAQINEDSIEAPHTWYYDILDVVFFISYDK